jgi:hypothetical protein
VEAFADGVQARTRFWGCLALLAAPAVWAIFLRRWVFDSWGLLLAWLPLLIVLMAPGLVLIGFGRRVGKLGGLPDLVSDEIGLMITEARDGIATEPAGGKTSGIGGLRSLIRSLKALQGYGDEIRDIVSGVVGTVRLTNPFYLLVVLGSAFGAGLLALLALGALVLLLIV